MLGARARCIEVMTEPVNSAPCLWYNRKIEEAVVIGIVAINPPHNGPRYFDMTTARAIMKPDKIARVKNSILVDDVFVDFRSGTCLK